MKFSHALGLIMSTVILTVFWIVGIGIYAIVLKIVTFIIGVKRTPESYWLDAHPTKTGEMKYPF